MRLPRLGGAVALVAALAAGFIGLAAEAAPVRGLVVSPAFQQVSIKPDQPSASYPLVFTNSTPADQTLVLGAVDFGSLDESGGVAFLGAPTSELEHKYGLASWMSLEKNTVVVPAGGKASVTVSIDNRQSLAPGGHYGAVLATAVNDPGTPRGDSVGVKQVTASLILVTKDGGARADLVLDRQTTNGQFWHLPTQVEQRYQNPGNVHVVPRGTVEVRDPAGRVVSRGAINDGSQVLLPESFRRYKTKFAKIAPAFLPGRYTLESMYRYDGVNGYAKKTQTFWYAGLLIVWIVVILAIGAAGFLGWWLWFRRRRKKR
jgi:hypothetical protein